MAKGLPAWALRPAGPEDRAAAREAQRRGTLVIAWPDLTVLRGWARQQGWPAPRLGFQAAFTSALLANDQSFALGLQASGIALQVPRESCPISGETLRELDALYAARSAGGRPVHWGSLVEALREMRRAVEAGVALEIDGQPAIRTWQGFYSWAHGRYHMLEDGYDHWIGDDRS
jgi:hypothetical protein